MYSVVSFLSSHPIVIASIVGILALISAFMPYLERWMRPTEYVYLGWVKSLSGESPLLDYRRFEWDHGTNVMIFPIPRPIHLEVQRSGSEYSSLMLLIPKTWGADAVMAIEGMEPANRHRSNGITLSIRHDELGEAGDALSSEYLRKHKEDGAEYTIQGIEWWNTATWNPDRRVQVAKPTRSAD